LKDPGFFRARWLTTATRRLFSFFIPGGLLLLIAFLLHRLFLVEKLPLLVRIYPYLVWAAGVLVAWRFNRSQLFFAILILAVSDRALFYLASVQPAKGTGPGIAYNAISFILPLNLLFISMMRELGFFEKRNLRRLSLVAFEIIVVALICIFKPFDPDFFLKYSFIKTSLFKPLAIAQPALFAFGLTFLILTIRYLRSRAVIECGFIWVLVLSFFALNTSKTRSGLMIYFATAGLTLVISVVETSLGLAFQDELTGLPTRRAFNEALSKLGSRYTIAMIDIDFFKKFNDRYGHHVGDQVLRLVASKLERSAGGGKAYRYGGEEFAMIFPGKDVNEAIPQLEILRQIVEELKFIIRSKERRSRKASKIIKRKESHGQEKITVSIGAADDEGRSSSPQDVIKAADQALYRAKRDGRNRISK
jgi:diguanylate cyclase (GGDEF)-like protein